MSEKIPLNVLLNAIDNKDRGFYDRLSEDERKAFSPFIAIRFASSVQAQGKNSTVINRYYLQNTAENVNKAFLEIKKEHKKLQWLLLTTISPGVGSHRHEWINFKSKKATSKRVKIIMDMYPDMKMSDVEQLSLSISNDEFIEYFKDTGMSDLEIKKMMKEIG